MRVGLVELIVIIIIAVVLIKPDKLSEYARSLARALHEFKNTKADIQEQIKPVTEIKDEVTSAVTDIKKDVSDAIDNK